LSNQTSRNVKQVILILGKRLVDNRLTPEGVSRIAKLNHYLQSIPPKQTILVFCGGVLAGQTRSEAEALWDEFRSSSSTWQTIPQENIIIENHSINTVQNIVNASAKLTESGLCERGESVDVVLASNDYHLTRIIEIQKMMPEQGLLTMLVERCAQAGLNLNVPLELTNHCSARYPHDTEQGKAFLLIDELTTFRVLLEGVVRGAFTQCLSGVAREPIAMAKHALQALTKLPVMKPYHVELSQLSDSVIEVELALNLGEFSIAEITLVLKEFDAILTQLNRVIDPEGIEAQTT